MESARNLPQKDFSTLEAKGLADPYCVMHLMEETDEIDYSSLKLLPLKLEAKQQDPCYGLSAQDGKSVTQEVLDQIFNSASHGAPFRNQTAHPNFRILNRWRPCRRLSMLMRMGLSC